MMRKKLCEISNPKQWKTISSDKLTKDGYPVYGANGIIGYYTEYNHKNETLLITCRGATCGTLNISQPFSYINGNAMALDDLSKDVDIKYLYYYLTNRGLNDVITGSAQPQIVRQSLEKVFVEYPELVTQKEIVDEFNHIEKIIFHRTQQLSKLNELVKARFVELFGDINTNDKGWETQPLGELCTIVRGGSPRPIENYLGGDVPWIKIGDATKGDNVYLHSTKEHIIQDGVKKSRMVKSGSLIFANCGVSLGFARIITFDGCIHDGWLAMEDIDERLDKVFLLQALNQMTDHFRNIAPAGTQPNLNTAIMKAYVQIIPPMELQRAYIAFVEQIDKAKFEVQQSLEKLETLKKSLMQQYFG